MSDKDTSPTQPSEPTKPTPPPDDPQMINDGQGAIDVLNSRNPK